MYVDPRHGHNFWQALRRFNGASFGTALAIRQGNTQSPVTGEPSAVVVSEAPERQMDAQMAPHQSSEPRFNLQPPTRPKQTARNSR